MGTERSDSSGASVPSAPSPGSRPDPTRDSGTRDPGRDSGSWGPGSRDRDATLPLCATSSKERKPTTLG